MIIMAVMLAQMIIDYPLSGYPDCYVIRSLAHWGILSSDYDRETLILLCHAHPLELHHYHNDDCGGIVSVAGTVSGSGLSYLALSASMVAVTFQVSTT